VSLTIRFELEARVELIRASEHYRNVSPEIGLEFSRAFRECVRDILNFPDAFKHVGDGVRRASLPRFPYFIYFTVDPDCVFVYALAHHKQDQSYWQRRTRPG
jgi:plasmid stabilization system protein ParE